MAAEPVKDFDRLILYADNHLLAVNKPPGLLTQPSPTCDDSLETGAKRWVKQVNNKPGKVFLHAVHRLDRVAGGVVLFARTSKALSRLQEQLRRKSWTKMYHALVERAPDEPEGRLVHYLRHASHRAKLTAPDADGARQAVLTYKLLRAVDRLYLVEVHLETGRYHQIRAQLAAIGCAVAGDSRYGAGTTWREGIALHHRVLEILHPVRREPLRFEAPYPASWPLRG